MCSVCEPFQKPGLNFLHTLSIELLAAAHNNRTGRACHLRIIHGNMGGQCLICVIERLACFDSQSQSFVFRGEIPENIMPGYRSVTITWLVPVQLFQQGRQLLTKGGTKYVEIDFQFTILSSDLLQHHCGDWDGTIVHSFIRRTRFIFSFYNAQKLPTISLLLFEITPAPFQAFRRDGESNFVEGKARLACATEGSDNRPWQWHSGSDH